MTLSVHAPICVVPPSPQRCDGAGRVIPLNALHGKLITITLGINNVLEQEALAVSIWGSASGTEWGSKPLLSFPRKSYCGSYSASLDLAHYPAVRFLRVEWKMSHLRTGSSGLMFEFSVSLQESHSSVNSAVA